MGRGLDCCHSLNWREVRVGGVEGSWAVGISWGQSWEERDPKSASHLKASSAPQRWQNTHLPKPLKGRFILGIFPLEEAYLVPSG